MPACLRCRTLVDTNVLLHVLCCSVQGQLKVILLCLLYVYRYCCFRSLVRAFFVLCAEEENQILKQKLRGCLWLSEALRLAQLMKQQALTVSLQEHFPNSHVYTSRLVLPRAVTWTEKSACLANMLAHTNTNARASRCCCCHGVVAVLRLVVVLLLLLPSLVLSRRLQGKNKRKK